MAIDTQNKRRSVHGYSGAIVAPVPDGAIGAGDREHVAWLYSGIAAAAPSIIVGVVTITWSSRKPSITWSGRP